MVSLRSLEYLASGCPLLESLALPIDAASPPPRRTPIARFRSLCELFVGSSLIPVGRRRTGRMEHWEELAEFMVDLFPSFTILKTVLDFEDVNPRLLVASRMQIDGMLFVDDRVRVREIAAAWRGLWGMMMFLRHQ